MIEYYKERVQDQAEELGGIKVELATVKKLYASAIYGDPVVRGPGVAKCCSCGEHTECAEMSAGKHLLYICNECNPDMVASRLSDGVFSVCDRCGAVIDTTESVEFRVNGEAVCDKCGGMPYA